MESPGHTDNDKDLQEAQKLAHVGSWVWDIETNQVTWSREQYRLFGREEGMFQPTFEGFLLHVPEAGKPAVLAAIQATVDGKGDYSIEHEILRADGSSLFVSEKGQLVSDAQGRPVRMFGITQDITDRKRYEAALETKQRELEVQAAFLNSIVENIPVGVFIKDIRDAFRVTLWNKAAEEIFQVKKEDIIGKTAHDLWPKEQADLYLAADLSVAQENKRVDTPEEPSQTKDRGTIFLHTIKLPLSIAEGAKPEYLLAISNDVTKEKRGTEELQAAKISAENANRAKSEFLAMMSHEIRTPMNGVIGMAQLLMETPLSKAQTEMVETLRYSGEILLHLIDDILDYSKIEAGRMELEMQPFDLENAVREIAGTMRPQADRKGLALTVSFPAGPALTAMGDPVRLRQVLLNLIGNAVKFTDAGSIFVEVSVEGPALRTEISDTGVGIPEESRHRIFDKFSQADASTTRKFGGTGLGLAISKRLMELMGGQLDFRSVSGRGSTFFLTLPMAPVGGSPAPAPAAAAARKSRESRPEPIPPGMHVLLAEDNIINQKVGEKILASLGLTVDLARNGMEAVAMAKRKAYDFILMDIHMPLMDGLTATREIRSWESNRQATDESKGAKSRMTIIALTASVMQNDRDISSHAGMDDFLSKPILIDALSRVLAAHARKWPVEG